MWRRMQESGIRKIMMLNLIALLSINMSTQAIEAQWAPIPNVIYLADRTDKQGVVAVTTDGKAHLIGPAGAIESTYTISDDSRALWYRTGDSEKSESLVVSRSSLNIVTGGITNPFANTFGQGNGTIIYSPGCTVMTPDSVFSVAKFSAHGAVAVRKDNRSIVVIDSPMAVPILIEHTFNGHEWSKPREPITPTIDALGFATPAAGFNDARFISAETVIFIGYIYSNMLLTSEEIEARVRPVIPKVELTLSSRANSTLFLFAVNLRTRMTHVVLSLKVFDSPEPRGQFFGRLSVSVDSKFVYILRHDGIARVELASLDIWK